MAVNKVFVIIGFVALVQSIYSVPIESGDCRCNRLYLPICGSDDVTYSNKCLFDCEKKRNHDLKINYKGECGEDKIIPVPYETEDCACVRNIDPVCGSDGITYINECKLNCARKSIKSLEMKHKGECSEEEKVIPVPYAAEDCRCTRNLAPVCGSDGITYDNECRLNCARKRIKSLEMKHKGECSEEEKVMPVPYAAEDCRCTRNLAPVCGSDGNTYTNECTFNCAKKSIKNLEMKHKGECSEVEKVMPVPYETEDCVCVRNIDPVCGSDGITYINECKLNCARKSIKGLEMKHKGECSEEEKVMPVPYAAEDCLCMRNLAPVCGSDGNTYANECRLNCARKIIKNLEMRHKGECSEEEKVMPVPYETEDCACTRNIALVCGSDGITYTNECKFKCARRNNKNLKVKHQGSC